MQNFMLWLVPAVIACGGASETMPVPDGSVTGDTLVAADAPPNPTPLSLAANEARPSSIAVFGGEVFWTCDPTTGAGLTRKLAPGADPVTLAGAENRPTAVAAGQGLIAPTVFWGTTNLQGQIRQIATTGAPPLSGAAVGDLVYALALSGDSVFVGTRSAVYRKNVANSASPVALASGYANGVTAISADATGVVFGARLEAGSWIVAAVARAGGTVTTLATGSEVVRDIVISGADVYWLENTVLKKVPRAGGTAAVVKTFAFEDVPWALVAAQGKLFIATNQGVINPSGATGRILELDTATGAERELATAQAEPADVAVDASHVYWANRGLGAGKGEIMRIARD